MAAPPSMASDGPSIATRFDAYVLPLRLSKCHSGQSKNMWKENGGLISMRRHHAEEKRFLCLTSIDFARGITRAAKRNCQQFLNHKIQPSFRLRYLRSCEG